MSLTFIFIKLRISLKMKVFNKFVFGTYFVKVKNDFF